MVSFAAPTSAQIPPPPTPVTKRPIMALKRSISFLDADDEANLTASTKRLRVAFDDRVDVRIMGDWDDKSFELVKEEVQVALHRQLASGEQSNNAQFSKLLQTLSHEAFSSEAPPTKLLHKYIVALTSKVAALSACGKLVEAVLDLSWLGRDEHFVEAYRRFLIVLASTHGKYIAPVMERLVGHFERLPASTGRLPGEEPIARAEMFERIHTTVYSLLQRIPSASSTLMRMLIHLFPNDLASAKGHQQYQKHLLRIAEAVPELKTEITALIVQRLVNIDVQIQADIEDLEEDEEAKLLQGPQKTGADEEDSDDSDVESMSESEMTTTEEEQKLRDLRLKVAKMDSTQSMLFEYYDPVFRTEADPKDNAAYQELLAQFSSLIMPNRSRHAQFLLFHFAQSSPAYANDFVQSCLRMTIDRNVANSTRQTACAYVASFTARGSHIPTDIVRSVFGVLCQYLEEMRRRYEPICVGPDRRSYSIYYAVVQALLYIFCFRWRDLVIGSITPGVEGDHLDEEDVLAEGHDLTWMTGMRETLTININSALNPLKVCSGAIVAEFAKIANHLRFLYVFTLLERNKRIRLGQVPNFRLEGIVDLGQRGTALDRKTDDVHHQLAPYFPFDPYHLPQSKRWLEGEYNDWKLPRGMRQDDDDDDDDDNSSESDDENDSDEETIPEQLTVSPVGPTDAISITS